MGELRWLHVSDLHLRGGDRYDANRVLDALLSAVQREAEAGWRPELVFVTGDIANRGKTEEYAWATELFDGLLAAAGLSGQRERLWVVPGNHDVDRDKGEYLLRSLASNAQADQYFAPDRTHDHAGKLHAYRAWYDDYFAGIRRLEATSTCGPVDVIALPRARVGVLPIDTAWFSQGDDDHGRLWVGRRCLDGALARVEALKEHTPADLWVALMHHPLEWLHDEERGEVQRKLRASMDVLLRGHLHESEVEQVLTHAGGCIQIAAGASYQGSRWPNRALLARWDGQQLRLRPIRHVDSQSTWTLDTELFAHSPDYEGTVPLPGQRPTQPPEPAVAKDVPPRTRETLHPFPGRRRRAQRRGGFRRELVVMGTRQGPRIQWSFRTPDRPSPFRERVVDPWSTEGLTTLVDGHDFGGLGERIGELLFGRHGQEQFHEIFRSLFVTERDERPGPAVGPVRCRLLVEDDEVAGVPWRLAADRGHWLTEDGWTFELASSATPEAAIQLPNPCSIVLLAPTWGALGRRAPRVELMIRELLMGAWPGLSDDLGGHLAVARSLDELTRKVELLRPHVVLALAHHVIGGTPALRLGSAGSVDRVPLAAIAERLRGPVRALYLATLGDLPLPLRAVAGGGLPCVIGPTVPGHADDVVDVMMAWLHGLLIEALDPVEAMHELPAAGPSRRWAGMRAHTDYFSWSTAHALALPLDGLAELRVDRKDQRALFRQHLDELVRDSSRRVESIVCFGSERDLPELLSRQLEHELDERELVGTVVVRQGVPLPALGRPTEAMREDLRRMLREELDARQGEELAAAVQRMADFHDVGTDMFVMWLDWGVADEHVRAGELQAWLRMAAEDLPHLCDGHPWVRVLSTLTVRLRPERFARFEQVMAQLARVEQSHQATIKLLPQLGKVKEEDLDRYLRDRRLTRCPEALIPAAAHAIIASTGGYFDDVIALIERTERGGTWTALAGEASLGAVTAGLDLEIDFT
ncbi:metallophosphoesterase family protein [Paraliomyxa miuraensis]|uniref:metallophosphoesterase family protein n=1 Tax=Paraliomyxa miuraensis TaxID=376150 RepID=UPI002251F231|nr:metallophosphoesterase [Paraliomyxa miuraensis]MCX4240321.1 metallophosphoesterase [Paraliomyxa miuraensis]